VCHDQRVPCRPPAPAWRGSGLISKGRKHRSSDRCAGQPNARRQQPHDHRSRRHAVRRWSDREHSRPADERAERGDRRPEPGVELRGRSPRDQARRCGRLDHGQHDRRPLSAGRRRDLGGARTAARSTSSRPLQFRRRSHGTPFSTTRSPGSRREAVTAAIVDNVVDGWGSDPFATNKIASNGSSSPTARAPSSRATRSPATGTHQPPGKRVACSSTGPMV
jgi:hypothetical protein